MFLIEGHLKRSLKRAIKSGLPKEVGGLILFGKRVVVLPNHAEGESAFAFHLRDIRDVIESHEIPLSEIADQVVLWHSHPGGGVGPSREDMRNKTPLKYHLVLAYVEGSIVPTWY
jgi:proteasome lid subunit RPN8/RPN11